MEKKVPKFKNDVLHKQHTIITNGGVSGMKLFGNNKPKHNSNAVKFQIVGNDSQATQSLINSKKKGVYSNKLNMQKSTGRTLSTTSHKADECHLQFASQTATPGLPNSSSPKLPNTAITRAKNEEAINDLRHRIPEIETLLDLHSRIGNGTFSTVLLGTLKKERNVPEDSRRKFAIKHHIPTSHPERIMKELQCMVKIGGQDNVVGINCCMRCNESVAFIMPYMPHDRFHDFYNKMDFEEIQFYMKNLLIALRRVHKFNVIHRDVKPSNFLYNRSRREFLLVDFGLAQQAPAPFKHQTAAAVDVSGGTNPSNRMLVNQDYKRSRVHEEIGLSTALSEASGTPTPNFEGSDSTTISGVPKRLRYTGPNGDQQVAGPGNSSFAVNNGSGGAGIGNPQFKMPLKQVNEISTANKVGNCASGNTFPSATGILQAPSNDLNNKYITNRNLSSANAPKCYCYGNPQVCNICLIRKEIHASRAGTPGYRPPEVLLKYPDQTTAVDMWAAGVIFLSILSCVYPFFKAPNDFAALAEMVTVFGDKAIRKTAFILDRLLTLSQRTKPIDLRKLCIRFRKRAKYNSFELLKRYQDADGNCEVCKNCDQYCFNCICLDSQHKTENIEAEDVFPPSAYDLLHKLLEVNPHHRITAEEALKHPFFNEANRNGGDHHDVITHKLPNEGIASHV